MDELNLQPADADEIPASEVGLETAPALRPGVGSAFLDDEAVLLDPATGASHVLDASAALVARLLDGRSTLAEIAFDISDVLGADRERVEADVVDLVRTLGAQGLVAGVARDPHAARAQAQAPEGVPVGADLGGWDGWADVAEGRTLVVNWGTRCGFCNSIVDQLGELAPRLREVGTPLLLVTTGDEASLREQLGDLDLPALHVDETPEFFTGLGTPVAYLVAADRTVVEPLAVGFAAVPELARRVVADG